MYMAETSSPAFENNLSAGTDFMIFVNHVIVSVSKHTVCGMYVVRGS